MGFAYMIKLLYLKGRKNMKRFITVLSGLLVLPAFAEIAPVYYEDDFIEYTDDVVDVDDVVEKDKSTTQSVSKTLPRTTINRSSARAISAGGATTSSRVNTSSRAVAANPRATVARSTTSRVAARGATTPTATRVSARSATSARPVTARVGVGGNVMAGGRTVTAATVKTLNDSNTKYNSTTVGADTAARVGLTGRRAAARMSVPVSTVNVVAQEDVDNAAKNMNALAELTELCKSQYAACMDNYCNVLDDNQGRCSCSKNVKNYEKTEQALKAATEQFQDVIQNIKYIGLSGEQIESLFAETEAEVAMRSNTDKSQLKTSLDSIRRKIVDVSSPSASSYEPATSMSFDLSGLLNADFTGGFDLSSFFNSANQKSTTSVTNQRGDQLYKSAANRCKTQVLDNCVIQGVESNVINNSYDLEIDKQCVIYERSLNEANDEMRNNVRNASTILQQARLMLAQNRNSYDLRGCVAAIDACMQDEYVCGSDYELCLDPTGKYISDGEIIIGSTPGVSGGMYANEKDINDNSTTPDSNYLNDWVSGGMYELYQAWNYEGNNKVGMAVTPNCSDTGSKKCTIKSAWGMGLSENLGGYLDAALTQWKASFKNDKSRKASVTSQDMATYLLEKIGYIDEKDKPHGMCASVMKQCQDYTYTTERSKRTYRPDNEVVRRYLASTLTKIKFQQDELLSSYVEDCRSDVTSCLSSNGYDESNVYTTASQTAVNACRAYIQTCMSVGGWKPSDNTKLTLRQMSDWVGSILTSCPEGYYFKESGATGGDWSSGCHVCEPALLIVATDKRTFVKTGKASGTGVVPVVAQGKDFWLDKTTYETDSAAAIDSAIYSLSSATEGGFFIGNQQYRVVKQKGAYIDDEISRCGSLSSGACGLGGGGGTKDCCYSGSCKVENSVCTEATYPGQYSTTEEGLANAVIDTESAGGTVTSCSCPSGYTQVTHTYTTDGSGYKKGEKRVFCVFTPETKSAQ